MGIELSTKVLLGQTLVLMQMTFLNNVRKVRRSVLSRTSCIRYRVRVSGMVTTLTPKHRCVNVRITCVSVPLVLSDGKGSTKL
jgi:hypothetical protein